MTNQMNQIKNLIVAVIQKKLIIGTDAKVSHGMSVYVISEVRKMQIMIDIPEDRYDEIHSLKFVMYGLQSEKNKQLFYRLINAVQDGTVLPDNPTNGDIIKAMFPNLNSDNGDSIALLDIDGFVITTFTKKWWNAPYKENKNEFRNQ